MAGLGRFRAQNDGGDDGTRTRVDGLQSQPYRPQTSVEASDVLRVADPREPMTGGIRPCCYRAMLPVDVQFGPRVIAMGPLPVPDAPSGRLFTSAHCHDLTLARRMPFELGSFDAVVTVEATDENRGDA